MTLSKRDKRLLAELSTNAREKQTVIAKRLRTSPQTTKYNLDALQENNTYAPHAIIDPARLGLLTIQTILSYTTFNKHTQQDIIEELTQQPDVVRIQRLRLGADLLVEYAVPNLSYFNKTHTAFLHRHSDAIRNKITYPVLVRYTFQKTYLHPKTKHKRMILSGDREPATISDTEQQTLHALINQPQASTAELARTTNHDPRTTRNAIQSLEKKKVIRGYSIDLNYQQTNITSALLGIQFSHLDPREMKRFIEFTSSHEEVVELTKVIGQERVYVTIETLTNYTQVIEELREEFKITNYTVFEAGNKHKNTYAPTTN